MRFAPVGLCLEVAGGRAEPGTPMWVWPCGQQGTPPEQAFNLVAAGQGWFYVRDRGGRRCLTVRDAGNAVGTPLTMEACAGRLEQQFSFSALREPSGL